MILDAYLCDTCGTVSLHLLRHCTISGFRRFNNFTVFYWPTSVLYFIKLDIVLRFCGRLSVIAMLVDIMRKNNNKCQVDIFAQNFARAQNGRVDENIILRM